MPRTLRSWLPERNAKRVTRPRQRTPLNTERLEDRLTPTSTPSFNYAFHGVNDPGDGFDTFVTISGKPGTSPVTVRASFQDASGDWIARIDNPPEPLGGLVGQAYWDAVVSLPQGYGALAIYSPLLNGDGLVYNAATFAYTIQPDAEQICIPCDDLPGLTTKVAPGNNNAQTSGQTLSGAGVGYYDGRVYYTQPDLVSDGYSDPFGQSRSWSLGTGVDRGQHLGNGWVNPNLPTINKANDIFFVTGADGTAQKFVPTSGGGVAPAFSSNSTLTASPSAGEMTLTDELGNKTVFYDNAPLQTVSLLDYQEGSVGPRVPQKQQYDRTESWWYSSTAVTLDLPISGTTAHKVTLYVADWDASGRSQRIELIDAATDTVVDTHNVSSFEGGVYLSWNVSGAMKLRLTPLTGPNAVLSGVFFDAASGSPGYVGSDATTLGDWRGAYGADGHFLVDGSTLPTYVTPTLSGQSTGVYKALSNEPNALLKHDYGRQEIVWTTGAAIDLSIDLTGTSTRTVTLSFLDWSRNDQTLQIQMLEATTSAVLDTRTVSAFYDGKYLSWNVDASVKFRITGVSGAKPVLNGVFFDTTTGSLGYIGTDSTTLGNWHGVYGGDGQFLAAGDASPTYATVSVQSPTPVERSGQFKKFTSVSGEVTEVVSYAASGGPSEIRRTGGPAMESWLYSYATGTLQAGLQTSVVYRTSTDGGVTWQTVRAVEYRYYDGTTANGNRNDLESVVVHDGGLTATAVRTSYYRYYLPGETNGRAGGMKFAVTDQAFDKLAAAFGVDADTVGSLSDANLSTYAERHYQYDSETQRVSSAVIQGDGCSACSGGQGTYTFSSVRNPHRPYGTLNGDNPEEQNTWYVAATETLPDGNTNKVYTNPGGQVMLKVYTEMATSQVWRTFTEFDPRGRILRTADAVAVTGYDDQYDDLLHKVNGNYQYLSDTEGEVTEYRYGDSTTAMATVPGNVSGYLQMQALRHGELARLSTPVMTQTYFAHSGGTLSVYPIASTTSYPGYRSTEPLYTVDMSTSTLDSNLSFYGPGVWSQSGGVLSQTDTSSSGMTKAAQITGQTWSRDQEILGSVRVDYHYCDKWPLGIGVRGDAGNGNGFGLAFREAGYVELIENASGGGGPRVPFDWDIGTWYRMRVSIEGDILRGKVWEEGTAEPLGWMVSVNVHNQWAANPGLNPYLLGGRAEPGTVYSAYASFKDVSVENIALPPGETTTYSYTWSSANPLQVQSTTVSLPQVSTGQNGSGTTDSVSFVSDSSGRPVWMKDAAGYLHYTEYDPTTGMVVKSIVDVDTSLTSDFTGLPTGWTTPSGGGKHLKTVTTVDSLGWVTKTVRPNGSVDHFTYDNATESAKTYVGWSAGNTTGPVQLTRRDAVGGDVVVNGDTLRYTYVETLDYAPTTVAVDGAGVPTGAEAVSNIQRLKREYFNQSGQLVYRDDYFDFTGLTYLDGFGKPVFDLGTEGVNFLRTRFAYDKQGRLCRVETPDGVINRTVFDGQGRITSEWRGDDDTPTTGYWSPTNAAGMVQVSAYEYDHGGIGNGNLTKLTRMPGGGAADRVTEMAYDWRNRLVGMKEGVETTESEGVNRPFTYFDLDNYGRVIRTRVYDGDTVDFEDADGNGVPDAPDAGRLRSQTETFYDAQGRVYRKVTTGIDQATGEVSETQWVTENWFDSRGLLAKTVQPGGLVTKAVYDGVGRAVTVYSTDGGSDSAWADSFNVTGDIVFTQLETGYDANSNVILTTFRDRVDGQTGTGALGTPTTGNLARVTFSGNYYDAADRLTSMALVGTNGGSVWTRPSTVGTRSDTNLVTDYTYDAAGRLRDVTDPMGYVGRTTYDLLGRVISVVQGNGTSVARTTSYEYDSGGRLFELTAPGGSVTRFGYDFLGRNDSVTRAYGTGIARATTTGFDNLDDVVSVTTPTGSLSSPGTVTTETGYDTVGRVSSITEAAGASLERTTVQSYDPLGRILSVTRPGSQTTGFAYDDVLMRRTTSDPLAHATTASFDLAGNTISVTDPLAHTTGYGYDLRNRLVSTTDALSNDTLFHYNVGGDRDTVTDARSNVTQTVFDRFGRTGSTVDPFGKSTTYEYDRDSRLASVTDRIGQKRAFTYNEIGQRTSELWYATGGTTLVQTQTYGYDAAGNLTGASDPDGDYTIAYDELNRPISVSGPFGFDLAFGYDAAGNRTSAADNAGGTQTSLFDILGRLTSRTLETSTGEARVDLGYTVRDRLDTLSRFVDIAGTTSAGTTTYGYDLADRLTGITHKKASGATIAGYAYAWDNASRLTSRTEGVTTQTFDYDDRNQVTNDDGTGYTFDATGNRTITGYTTSSVGNRLTSDGLWAYTYDDEGQLTKKSQGSGAETWTYGYDHRGQMTWAEQRATDGGTLLARVEYVYDAFGNRIERIEKDGSSAVVKHEKFAFDGWDTAKPGGVKGTENFDVWADLDASDDVTMRRMYGTGFDQPLARIAANGDAAWYLTDDQGSVREVVDGTGTTLESSSYTAFGVIVAPLGTGFDRYAYTGREWDATLELQYNRARMYDPDTGRFTREDQMGLAAGDVNTFRYVGNAVTIHSDPSGLFLGEEHATAAYNGFMEIPAIAWDIGTVGGTLVKSAFTDNWQEPTYASKTVNEFLKNTSPSTYDNRVFDLKAAGMAAIAPLTFAWDLGTALGTGDSLKLAEMAGGAAFFTLFTGKGPIGNGKAAIKLFRKSTDCPAPANSELNPTRPKSCFPAGTLVHTPSGLVKIEDIQMGQAVWSFDHRKMCWSECAVVETYIIDHIGTMATIIAGGETTRATGGHPYWVVSGEGLADRPRPVKISAFESGSQLEGRWVLSRDLRVGDTVFTRQMRMLRIESLELEEVTETVYNFHVQNLQNYAIGLSGILVHNTNDPPRVRHHTSAENLKAIADTNILKPGGRESALPQGGPAIHVETQPFGPVTPIRNHGSPAADFGLREGGAYVEFNRPATTIPSPNPKMSPNRNAGEILVPNNDGINLEGLNPVYVKVSIWSRITSSVRSLFGG